MTPKEKAIELINTFTIGCYDCDYNGTAKQLALIAVNILLESRVGYPYPHEVNAIVDNGILNQINYPQKYWNEVKIQIKKL